MSSISPTSDIKPRINSSPIKPFREDEARSIRTVSHEDLESEEFNFSISNPHQQTSNSSNNNNKHRSNKNNQNHHNNQLTGSSCCKHQSRPLWSSEDSKSNNDNHNHNHSHFQTSTIFKNLLTVLKNLECFNNALNSSINELSRSTSSSTSSSAVTLFKDKLDSNRDFFNAINFCFSCKSFSSPRVICLGCGIVNCYLNESGSKCYQINHNSKPSKCRLGFDLICRELICMVCGEIVQPDDNELRVLSKKLFPPVKKPFMPACLSRTTSSIFPLKGIRNLGSSCYMSVILQVLLRIPELQCYLLTDHHNRLKHRTTDEIYCCACELVEILQSHSGWNNSNNNSSNSNNGNGTNGNSLNLNHQISPVGFLYCLWMNSGDGEDFAGYRESDAHECLLACLNQLHSATQVPNTIESACQCPIHLLFRCELKSELICGNCNAISDKIDPILDLSLEIGHLVHLEPLKLSDCLASYTESEMLNEKCYTCNECGVASPNTSKSLKISQLPHILCIQLKRFEHLESGSAKIDRRVEFPLVLDMRPYTTDPKDPNELNSNGYYYKLMGIIRHQGNAASGHYQAIVYQDEQYFCFNDGSVNILRLKEVLEIEAYLLIYSFILNP